MASMKGIISDYLSEFQPPPGTQSNYVDPPSLATFSLVFFPVLACISLVSVMLRITHNYAVMRELKPDDWCILVAVVFMISQVISALTETKMARHTWDIKMSWIDAGYLKGLFAQIMAAWVSLLFTKLSILFLYLRIFEIKRNVRYAIYVGMVWSLLTYLPYLVVLPYFCAPRYGEPWNYVVGLRCADNFPWQLASGAMAMALDVYIFILPLPLLKGVNMSKRRKWGLKLVFLTGSLAIICATLTFIYRLKLKRENDIFWNTWILIITAVTENNVAITVACVPGVRAFIKLYIPPFSRKASTSTTRYNRSSFSHIRHRPLRSTSGLSSSRSYGSEAGYELHLHSTSHLSGWKESKDGKVFTEVSNLPRVPGAARLGEPRAGITKCVDFEQSSSRGSLKDFT